ncbi:MAG: pyridoxamine 5'-phosphate oxidase family protein [Alphaproteobacteria bacterium]|nr:pyridoxamine 5'-phosphate oxidase family protein [Alphaproteobacteria bacterium]
MLHLPLKDASAVSDTLVTDAADAFPVSARNKIKRMHERGAYDKAAVFAILDAALLCHVSYVIDGQPFCTPTLFWREGETLYWHGSSASRMLKHLKEGTPACLTVSHLDGLVLARSGFHHSVNYRSAMCFGTARFIEDADEKLEALKGVVDRFYPGRTKTLRPIDPQEFKATTVIRMPIDEASAKVRAKTVADDEEDYAAPLWAGVIPVAQVIGAEEPCPRLIPGTTRPDNLSAYREGRRLDETFAEMHQLYQRGTR